MKRAYLLEVVLGVFLIGSTAYAETGMRGGSVGGGMAGFGAGGFNGHVATASFHGDSGMRASFPVQRNMGEPRGISHPGVVGGRISGDRRMFPPRGGFGDRHVFRGGLFEHGCGHGHGIVVFAYSVPYFYYPDHGYYDSAPYYAQGPSTEYTTDPDTQTDQYANQDAESYYQPGFQWGGELKLYHVTMDQFVAYLKSYILSASPVQQAAFRTGFVAHFGADGQAIYDQAVRLAIQQN